MTSRRIAYGLALTGAIAFQIFYEGYIAHIIFILTIILPFLSLAISLPGISGFTLRLAPPSDKLTRGAADKWRIIANCRRGLPLAAVALWVKTTNKFTGEEKRFPLELSGVTNGTQLTVPVNSKHCGLLECRVEKVRAYDYLGLFAFKRELPEAALLTVMPQSMPVERLPEADNRHSRVFARPAGSGEDYEIRDYRPGDPLRAVHWKLSSKQDELLVRETMEVEKAMIVLTFDHFGEPIVLDRLFDRISSISSALVREDQKHTLRWIESGSGIIRSFEILCENDLSHALKAALAERAPATGKSISETDPAVNGSFHIRAEEGVE